MSDRELVERLKQELYVSEQAETAYNIYLKQHIAKVTENLFNEFSNTSVENMDRVMEIKRLHAAVKALEVSVLNDIDTGKMAAKQLELILKDE